jgi:hypothetical protein
MLTLANRVIVAEVNQGNYRGAAFLCQLVAKWSERPPKPTYAHLPLGRRLIAYLGYPLYPLARAASYMHRIWFTTGRFGDRLATLDDRLYDWLFAMGTLDLVVPLEDCQEDCE